MKVSCKLTFCLVGIVLSTYAWGENQVSSSGRKYVAHPTPPYPALARTMNISGVVRLEATVAPNGSVKSIDVKGGSPLLAQSAEFTVRQWKWEKLDHATTEQLEINFKP
jgi:TonB family protein